MVVGMSDADPPEAGPIAKAIIGKPLRAERTPNAVASFMFDSRWIIYIGRYDEFCWFHD